MNLVFAHEYRRQSTLRSFAIACAALVSLNLSLTATLVAQNNGPAAANDFRQLAAQLSTARLDGATDSQPLQAKALEILDRIAISLLGTSAQPDLEMADQRLAALVSPTPAVGESYHLVRLGGAPPSYALVVNFGLGGPAAVRIYSPGASGGHLEVAGGIDSFSKKDFFDSDIELIPVSAGEPVFVVVSGRTDDLSTGVFSAWRLSGHEAALLWSSDLLQQSSYNFDEKGFHLTYCAEPDDNHPERCPKMSSDLYQWQGSEWKRIESKPATTPSSVK